MKKCITLIAFVTFSISAWSQTPSVDTTKSDTTQRIKTLFDNTGKLGWWIAPEFAWTKFDDQDALIMGLSSGIIVHHSFSLGAAGYGIVNSGYLKFSGKNDTAAVYLYGGYGGLKMEFRVNPLDIIHFSFPLLIGGGGAVYSTWGGDRWQNNNKVDRNESTVWDSYFVIEPGMMLGVNLMKFMRVDLGLTYRYTSKIHLPRTDGNLMSNLNVGMSLKFGKF